MIIAPPAAPIAGAGCRSRLRPTRVQISVAAFTISALLAGCGGPHDVLGGASPEARHISALWWIFFYVTAAVLGIVILFLLGAIWRAKRNPPERPVAEVVAIDPGEALERRLTAIVGSAVTVTIVILFALLVTDFFTGRALRPPTTSNPLTIRVTGHQWWWQLDYDDPMPGNVIHTANELHLPLGRPVQLILQSSDVIHSFWLPNLQGKKDLIPGKTTTLWFTPDRLGEFRGQCAEFCGYQHAHMGLTAVVDTPADFAHWQETQRKSAEAPKTEGQKQGQQVFLTHACVMCHTIGGTPAGSHVGPPLTHFASRERLAAESFPNNRGYLAGWVLDAQALKPGAKMPPNVLSSDDLQSLLDYLENLK